VHVQPKNAGASEARNEGVRRSRGQLVTFIDSDDALQPAHLETAVKAFQTVPNLGLFCCDSQSVGPEGELLLNGRTWHEVNSEIQQFPVRTGVRCLRDIFLFSNCFPGFTLDRQIYLEVGGLDQGIFPLDDYDLALRIAGRGHKVYYCHQPLARYRVHDGNCSGVGNAIKVATEKLRCLRQALAQYEELRVLGNVARRRLADVELELAIAYALSGRRIAAANAVFKTLLRSPGHLTNVARLVGRKLRNRASKPTK
jgi:glycosyltransferase involved in cell wall biosynthesis